MGVEGTRSLPGSSSSTRDTVGGSVLEPQVTLSQTLMDLECSTRSRVKLQRPSSASTWQVVDQGEVQSNSPHSLVGHYHQGSPVTLQPSSARLGEVTRRVEGDRISREMRPLGDLGHSPVSAVYSPGLPEEPESPPGALQENCMDSSGSSSTEEMRSPPMSVITPGQANTAGVNRPLLGESVDIDHVSAGGSPVVPEGSQVFEWTWIALSGWKVVPLVRAGFLE